MGDIRPLDTAVASDAELAGYHRTLAESAAAERPGDPPLPYDAIAERLRAAWSPFGRASFWTARVDGAVVGVGETSFGTGDNENLAVVGVTVRPAWRGRGIGVDLLRAMLPAIEANGCGVVVGSGLTAGGVGDRWARGLGFEVRNTRVLQWLVVADVPAARWDVPVPAGYRLARWIDVAPDSLIESYVRARPAIQDAPVGRSSYRETDWTVASVRAREREYAAMGTEERVVVAIEDASDTVVGVTGVLNHAFRRTYGVQNDTSVLAAHRGHGLGVVLKSAMMRWLVAQRPDIERVVTSTSASNKFMIGVNLALGYETVRTLNWTEVPTTRLLTTLASRSVTQ